MYEADLKLAKTLKEWIGDIATYCTHGINIGVAESIISKFMSIMRRVDAYRNIGNAKSAILFYCVKLDLYSR